MEQWQQGQYACAPSAEYTKNIHTQIIIIVNTHQENETNQTHNVSFCDSNGQLKSNTPQINKQTLNTFFMHSATQMELTIEFVRKNLEQKKPFCCSIEI